ncbi:biofilm development regulator YmgB/AriR family protein [Pantoea vagans]|uniref:biofilm development regulator YmgB/AriR family protein n=1 Tax=Pantoea vagans TaxID=470934 RepID=UPI001093CD50|nr:biofilm development regulator YmgB/AriR family protein [Pantoea vagans]QCA06643.1 transcriptional regulator [Pantoea vagans]
MQLNTTEQNILQQLNEHGDRFAAEAAVISNMLQRLKARGGRVLRRDMILALIAEIESTPDVVRLDVLRCALEVVVCPPQNEDHRY